MAIDRDMVDRGEVTPHFIGANGGVLVPPALRIDTSTLREHDERLARERRPPLTEDERLSVYGIPVTAPGRVPHEQRPDGTYPASPFPETSIAPPQPHAEESDE